MASVVPAGKVPKDTTPTTSTASLPVLARRFLADPHEIGRFEGIGPDLWELGAASTRASVGREPVTAEDCGSDCGTRADPRERGPPCAGGHGRRAEAGECRSSWSRWEAVWCGTPGD